MPSRDKTNFYNLIDRLRDLETAILTLSLSDLPPEYSASKKTYESRLNQLENSHSRSWFGEHANTYFYDFATPPAGSSFDVEWGFIPSYHGSRNSGWRPHTREEMLAFVFEGIGEDIFHAWHALAEKLFREFSIARDQAIDVIEALAVEVSSKSCARYLTRIEKDLIPSDTADFMNSRAQSAPRMTRDSEEVAKGTIVPLHVQHLSTINSVVANKEHARNLAAVLRNVIEATTLGQTQNVESRSPKTLFIGHGRSNQWLTLRDFVRDRLNLEFDEFNSVSIAGITNQERLSQMLEECSFALLVMTGEDEHGDGSLHARENVIHEIGLFQGQLGWRKAIVLIEDGCKEFSNILGLGQIRYEKGSIASCFEEVRRVLEREQIL